MRRTTVSDGDDDESTDDDDDVHTLSEGVSSANSHLAYAPATRRSMGLAFCLKEKGGCNGFGCSLFRIEIKFGVIQSHFNLCSDTAGHQNTSKVTNFAKSVIPTFRLMCRVNLLRRNGSSLIESHVARLASFQR